MPKLLASFIIFSLLLSLLALLRRRQREKESREELGDSRGEQPNKHNHLFLLSSPPFLSPFLSYLFLLPLPFLFSSTPLLSHCFSLALSLPLPCSFTTSPSLSHYLSSLATPSLFPSLSCSLCLSPLHYYSPLYFSLSLDYSPS